MAKLLIFRGETQLDERELTEQTVRIGRGAQNDIVLEDPGKGVSRNHAEIRFEGGRYTLIDLQSQNGIWVSGKRVPSVVLEPGVSAALGPFRLMVEAPAASPLTATGPISGSYPATEMTQLSSRTAAPLELDSLVPAVEKPSPVTPPAAKPPLPPTPVKAPSSAKTPSAKPAAEKTASPPAQKTSKQQPPSSANTRVLAGVFAAVVLIALSAFIGYKLMHKRAPVTETAAAPPTTSVPVTPIATSTIPAPPTSDERLTTVEPLVTANVVADCQTALETINAVLAEDPNNERAKGLLAKANACVNPKPGVTTAAPDKPATLIPPSQGGLEVIQGETEKAYRTRVQAMRKKYEDALAVLASQKYVQAMRALDEILPDVPSGYLDLAARRDEARAAIRAEAKSALAAAQAAENRGDFDAAIESYRRAHQLDQSIQIDDALQRIADRKLQLGRKRCNDGLTEFSFGNNAAAIPQLQEATRLLSASDPCFAKAKDALQRMGK